MTAVEKGELVYTKRGFLQDAQDAMRGDVIRALIELITNADDAYDGKGGQIVIEVSEAAQPFKWKISIHDQASGLDANGLKKAFTHLGDENKKFAADQGTRGLFGRGAKDVAVFGKARFHSIKNGTYSDITVLPTAQWELNAANNRPTEANHKELNLELGQSGLTAELYISEQHKIPNSNELIEKLQCHVQLRDLMNRNNVILRDSRIKQEKKLIGLIPSGKEVLDIELEVPGYKMKAKLKVYKFEEKVLGSVTNYSKHGLVISGRGAAYENGFLTFDGRPECGWFCGYLDAPEIHDLARATDEENAGKDPKNPTRVVSRQRDGLVKNHPFFRSLAGVVATHLKPLFDEVSKEEGASKREGAELRKKLDKLEHELGRAMQDLLDESDLGEIPTENNPDDFSQELQFIPPKKNIENGETAILTIRAPKQANTDDLVASVLQNKEVVSVLNFEASKLKWAEHSRLPVKQATISVIAKSLGVATLAIGSSTSNSSCQIVVIDKRTQIDEIPKALMFERDSYSLSPSKRRRLLIKAPLESVGEIVTLNSSSNLIQVTNRVKLASNESGDFAQAMVFANSGAEQGTVTVTADLNGSKASTIVKITEPGQSKYPKIHTEVVGNENPPRRVDMVLDDDGRLHVKIFGRHPSLQRVFGKHQGDEKGFINEQSPEANATIGEIVAQQLAIYVVEQEAAKHPERFTDSSSAFARQQEFVPKFIQLLQLILLDTK